MSGLDWIGFAGSLASIIGLGVTVWIWFKIREISRGFLLRARVPELIRSLRKDIRRLSDGLREFDERQHDLKSILAACEAKVDNIRSKLPRRLAEHAADLHAQIRSIQNRMSSADAVWSVHKSLIVFVTAVEEHLRDVYWETDS